MTLLSRDNISSMIARIGLLFISSLMFLIDNDCPDIVKGQDSQTAYLGWPDLTLRHSINFYINKLGIIATVPKTWSKAIGHFMWSVRNLAPRQWRFFHSQGLSIRCRYRCLPDPSLPIRKVCPMSNLVTSFFNSMCLLSDDSAVFSTFQGSYQQPQLRWWPGTSYWKITTSREKRGDRQPDPLFSSKKSHPSIVSPFAK